MLIKFSEQKEYYHYIFNYTFRGILEQFSSPFTSFFVVLIKHNTLQHDTKLRSNWREWLLESSVFYREDSKKSLNWIAWKREETK